MSPGSHAAADGSFRRDAGVQVGKALFLIAVAVVVGVLLLHHYSKSSTQLASTQATTTIHATATTAPKAVTTTVATTTATTTTTIAPAALKVIVANGTTTTGAAGFFKVKLVGKGYATVTAVNATSTSVATSAVYYQPGFSAEADTLATDLGLTKTQVVPLSPSTPVATSFASASNVVVVVGANLSSQVSS